MVVYFTRIGRKLFSTATAKKPVPPRAGDRMHNFSVKEVHEIKELDLTLIKMEHEPTGAAHWHVARDDPNCVFCVAFRTPPPDSTGLPHILEHTTLCGSERYPVRDPFFKMLNRSMASYMNAWTASEHTAYPFCTANPKDYANLRSVYCDAVFRPKLRKLDFMQEGWRLENEDVRQLDSPLTLKGVVYNEMKGAFSDVESLFAQRLQQNRFPETIYGHVSGGDPKDIPNLTHEQLVEFHRKHYHPSNALFYTYGSMEITETLAYLNSELSRFSRQTPNNIQVAASSNGPRIVQITSPVDPSTLKMGNLHFNFLDGDMERQCKTALSFIMNDVSRDAQETFHLRILSHLLLEGSSAPLYKALIDSNIGQDYAPGTGYDASTKLATFSVGLQGIQEGDVETVKEIVYRVLEECKRTGFPASRIESVLHLLELGTKYQSAQYGLSLSHRLISSWVYGSKPEQDLAVNERIAAFKEAYAKGGLFEGLIENYFLRNSSPLQIIMKPSPDYSKELEEAEKRVLEEKASKLTEKDKKIIFEENLKLAAEQDAKENVEVLPCLKFDDVALTGKTVEFKEFCHHSAPRVYWRSTPSSNGISFVKALIPFTPESSDDLKLLPLACQVLTELGIKGLSLEQFDEETKRYTGGLVSSLFLGRQPFVSQQQPELALRIGTHALDHNVPRALDLLHQAISKADFSNLARLKTVVAGNASSLMNSIAASGHAFAQTKAASALSPRGRIDEELSGLTQALFMNELASKEDLGELSSRLLALSASILDQAATNCRIAVVASDDAAFSHVQGFHESLLRNKSNSPHQKPLELSSKPPPTFVEMPFATNYAAQVFQFNPYNLKDAANLAVLSKILRSGLLHKEIREKGGAYGGGASFSPLNGTFSFFSYRDPNPSNSLSVFERAPRWFLEHKLTEQEVLEAKLSVFSALDAPVDISSEGLHNFYYGISDVDRQLYREQLLAVHAQSLKETVERLFESRARSQTCVIGHKKP